MRATVAQIAALGGPTTEGQIEAAIAATLGRLLTGATLAETPIAELAAAGGFNTRQAAEGAPPYQDRNPTMIDMSTFTLAERAQRSGMTIDARRASEENVARGTNLQRPALARSAAPQFGEAGIGERARRSGMTIEDRRRAEANVERGTHATRTR